jgi:glycosyltransferase involved in cell wall biosynthesis
MIILYVGRLVEKKGVGDLIQAFARLAGDLREKTHLWIVGHGELENSLETMSRELGVGDRIKFWGEIPNDQLPDYYAAADLFVGPSVEATSGDTEGQGVVFIEAFAAGLCVIATTVGGIPEVVDHGRTGILVPPKNPNELAGAIQQLLSDSVLRQRLARNAQDEAREHYAWPRIADEFVTLYSDIATKREVG